MHAMVYNLAQIYFKAGGSRENEFDIHHIVRGIS